MRVLTGCLIVLLQIGVLSRGDAAAQATPARIITRSETLEALRNVDAGSSPLYQRLLTALGGAAVGAGVGFFTSQVFTGDWDEEPGRYQVDRSLWAAVGGSVGFVVGFAVPFAGTGRPAPERAPGLRGGRFSLSAEEISGKGVKTALEAVELLRPEWLITRGPHVPFESPEEMIVVYLDHTRLGGVRNLRDVGAETVRSIHFMDAGAASVRYGAGHHHGAILVIAQGGISGGSTP